ncbi:bifunctional (p)ppGpp synthetase/guanosine-3',5'-bis(diphosphate) 3'-pyrophosphohydrolase [Thiorhodococcus mannitoliphagus]|uniref:Bifunctional (P)ppGpp synthetase/guanosine-3',5'-bis(Diphosphate) 3'-pyrophosphohydrolase n=1 Tax=Thiorhodococcus mannitoliphagus TaxID=329406 RepID=A0A6P1DXV2_9GAMM|nr:HD domain-containing protein [Thiorhodococcus mannitoliphagus]NEX23028.1 bifunctional (p)ppGpp synthetase/guanosine-3',5'-bis(diphosphate) 3'-pyrophosphohydrolase [Thiorhodococcus mannitoliphagus]
MDHASLALLIDALSFAAQQHRNQRRRDPDASPYINHPIDLIRVLSVEGGVHDPQILCAALLHDVLEDCATEPQELLERFGAEICNLVMEVSDDTALPKVERRRQQVLRARSASQGARLIKLADKICNIRQMPVNWDDSRSQSYFDFAAEVITQVRGTHMGLESLFDQAFANRSAGGEFNER